MNEKMIEAVAREYCQILGLDPNAGVENQTEGGAMTEQWQRVAQDVRQHVAIEAAIARVLYSEGV